MSDKETTDSDFQFCNACGALKWSDDICPECV